MIKFFRVHDRQGEEYLVNVSAVRCVRRDIGEGTSYKTGTVIVFGFGHGSGNIYVTESLEEVMKLIMEA